MEFGSKLKEIRLRKKLSQKELSEKTGLTLRTIQRIENSEVKPSLYSIKVIGEALSIDLTEFVQNPEPKPYEFNLIIKITDMNQFIADLKTLVKNNWKILLLIGFVILFLTNYQEIKAGLVDGWNSR